MKMPSESSQTCDCLLKSQPCSCKVGNEFPPVKEFRDIHSAYNTLLLECVNWFREFLQNCKNEVFAL